MTATQRSLLSLSGISHCTRRTFLLSALLSVTAGGFGARRDALASSGPEPCVAPPWLWKTIADRKSAARLGRAYVDAHPEYHHCSALLAQVERTLTQQGLSATVRANEEHTASTLRSLLRKEYANGEVVAVAGWILSKTEAHLYALVYSLIQIDESSQPQND